MQHKKLWIPPVIFITLFFARPAQAYIDPGTGSCVLQVLLGIAFGLAYTVKLYWRQIRAYFGHARAEKD